MSNYKKTIRSYTNKDKILILRELEQSENSIYSFSKIKNIPRKTLNDWYNQKEKILNIEKENLNNKKIGSGNKPILNKTIEKDLLNWILYIRSEGLPITDELIICRAKFLIKDIAIQPNCNFSNGWLQNFKNRHNIVSRKGGSKIIRKDDCKLETITNFIKLVNEKINSNKFSSIINIDETGICYDSKINFTLDIEGTKRIEIKTTGREKQRVTVILGIDLLHNIKLNPFIILKGKTTVCIKNIPIDNNYNISYQQNSWCTEDQFIKYLTTLPNNKKILLLYDNFKGHTTEKIINFIKEKLPLIEILLLPPNTTSILQPLDVGVNKPFKSYIRTKYINWIVEQFEINKTLPKLDRNKLLVKWIIESWSNINNEIIDKSFEFCGYNISTEKDPSWKKFYHE